MRSLELVDAIGFAAAAFTLVTFAQTSMRLMRMTAIAANLCFISYGALGGYVPIVVLHVLLLPINVVRLAQLRSGGGIARLQGERPEHPVRTTDLRSEQRWGPKPLPLRAPT